jgi:formylglycine-generating enzyme required for sulfatase activity
VRSSSLLGAAALGLAAAAARAQAPAPAPAHAAYRLTIPGSDLALEMVPIPAGEFTMGSPESEPNRKANEGPQRRVRVDAFWMAKHEVTWDLYELWASSLEQRRRPEGHEPSAEDERADGISRPTPPYTDMTFGMGKEGYPAVCMTHHAAVRFCEWLSARTGHFYRVPTEAEWEYACRAGSATAYSFGDDAARLGDHAWFRDNSKKKYHKVGEKAPNAWGLHDMHGNVSEWCIDQFAAYAAAEGVVENPVVAPAEPYPHVARGGSFKDRAPRLRSAAREASSPDWKMRDPQIPQSDWYMTDAEFNGFRVVRPVAEPNDADRAKFRSPIVERRR